MHSVKDSTPLPEEPDDDAPLELGGLYSSRDKCFEALQEYAMTHHFGYHVHMTKKKYVLVGCKAVADKLPNVACFWHCAYHEETDTGYWRITTLVLPETHNCPAQDRYEYAVSIANKLPVLLRAYGNMVRADPFVAPIELMKLMEGQGGVEIHYWQAWRLREHIIKEFYGDWKESFRQIPLLVDRFQVIDPEVKVHLDTLGGLFHRFFIRPSAARHALTFCRPVIAFDGTHLISAQKAVLLVAVTLDGNQKVLLLAWGLVESENKESWTWFLKHFIDGCPEWTQRKHASIISDRDKGLVPAAREVMPSHIPHYFCAWHLEQNLRRFKAKAQKYFWRLERSTYEGARAYVFAAGRQGRREARNARHGGAGGGTRGHNQPQGGMGVPGVGTARFNRAGGGMAGRGGINAPNAQVFGRTFRGAAGSRGVQGASESDSSGDDAPGLTGGEVRGRATPGTGAFQFGGAGLGVGSGTGCEMFGPSGSRGFGYGRGGGGSGSAAPRPRFGMESGQGVGRSGSVPGGDFDRASAGGGMPDSGGHGDGENYLGGTWDDGQGAGGVGLGTQESTAGVGGLGMGMGARVGVGEFGMGSGGAGGLGIGTGRDVWAWDRIDQEGGVGSWVGSAEGMGGLGLGMGSGGGVGGVGVGAGTARGMGGFGLGLGSGAGVGGVGVGAGSAARFAGVGRGVGSGGGVGGVGVGGGPAQGMGGYGLGLGSGAGVGGVGVGAGIATRFAGVGRGVGSGGGVGGLGMGAGTARGMGGYGLGLGSGAGVGGVGVGAGSAARFAGVGRGVGSGGGVGGVGVGGGPAQGMGGFGLGLGSGAGVGGVGVGAGSAARFAGVGRGVGSGGGVGGLGMGAGTTQGVGGFGLGLGSGPGVGGVGVRVGTAEGDGTSLVTGGEGVGMGPGSGLGGEWLGVGARAGRGHGGAGMGAGAGMGGVGLGMSTGAGFGGVGMGPGFTSGTGSVFRYGSVGMGHGSGQGTQDGGAGFGGGGGSPTGGVAPSGGIPVAPGATRAGGPFNLGAIRGRAQEGYSAAAIINEVAAQPGDTDQNSWRHSALDVDDNLHAGLTEILALPWPDTGPHGDALHAGEEEPGYEDDEDVPGEGVPGAGDVEDEEEGGIHVQTGFHRNRQGSRYRIGGIQLVHWARFAATRRYGIYTSNVAETLNGAIKKIRMLPPTWLLASLWDWFRDKWYEHRAEAWRRDDHLTAAAAERMTIKLRRSRDYFFLGGDDNIGTIQTRGGEHDEELRSYNVNLVTRSCECGNWQEYKFPCAHAVTMCVRKRRCPEILVSHYYTTSNQRKMYAPDVHGTCVDRLVREAPPAPAGVCDAPHLIETRVGRPENNERMEARGMSYKCGRCEQYGHNRSTCKWKFGGYGVGQGFGIGAGGGAGRGAGRGAWHGVGVGAGHGAGPDAGHGAAADTGPGAGIPPGSGVGTPAEAWKGLGAGRGGGRGAGRGAGRGGRRGGRRSAGGGARRGAGRGVGHGAAVSGAGSGTPESGAGRGAAASGPAGHGAGSGPAGHGDGSGPAGHGDGSGPAGHGDGSGHAGHGAGSGPAGQGAVNGAAGQSACE
ncbi:unnamed protein product [Closterium sp. Yama58-4]|nr:unnamed protein product [Closterium sp. Yama58-4]